MDAYVDTLIAIFEEIKAQAVKPFIVCWVAAPDNAMQALRARGIAVLRGAEPAVDAIAALVNYSMMRRQRQADRDAARMRPPPPLELPAAAGPVATSVGAQLLQSCGVALAHTQFAETAADAVAAAGRIGYPVALKIESPEIMHKTDAGGVALRLADAAAVAAAFARVVENARRYNAAARIDGVIVQQMAPEGIDMVIGLQNDPLFGPVVMAGLGGIHVEIFKDIAFRKAPVSVAEAGRMLDELKSGAILQGVRGGAAIDRTALTRLISAVSQFGVAAGERLAELDLNPVRTGPDGALALDWLLLCR
jgi:acyl-CoA synthetase (NDP forming)